MGALPPLQRAASSSVSSAGRQIRGTSLPSVLRQRVDGAKALLLVAPLRPSPLRSPRIGGADGQAASLESQHLHLPPRNRALDSLGTSCGYQTPTRTVNSSASVLQRNPSLLLGSRSLCQAARSRWTLPSCRSESPGHLG